MRIRIHNTAILSTFFTFQVEFLEHSQALDTAGDPYPAHTLRLASPVPICTRYVFNVVVDPSVRLGLHVIPNTEGKN